MSRSGIFDEIERFLAESKPSFQSEGVLFNIWPIIVELVGRLCVQIERPSNSDLKLMFADAVESINAFSDEIITEEREIILESLYRLADILSLESGSQFLEQWRGDW